MKIVVVCGMGIGTSGILKINTERALERIGQTADVVASDLKSVATEAADAQIILTSPELTAKLPATDSEVIEIINYLDPEEIAGKLEYAL